MQNPMTVDQIIDAARPKDIILTPEMLQSVQDLFLPAWRDSLATTLCENYIFRVWWSAKPDVRTDYYVVDPGCDTQNPHHTIRVDYRPQLSIVSVSDPRKLCYPIYDFLRRPYYEMVDLLVGSLGMEDYSIDINAVVIKHPAYVYLGEDFDERKGEYKPAIVSKVMSTAEASTMVLEYIQNRLLDCLTIQDARKLQASLVDKLASGDLTDGVQSLTPSVDYQKYKT